MNSQGGIHTDVEKAAEYLTELAGGDMEYNAGLLSCNEQTIQAFIYDGYPVVRLNGYLDVGFPGHVTIIIGYKWNENGYYEYLINDPWLYNSEDNRQDTLTYDELLEYNDDSHTYLWGAKVVVDTHYD